MGWCRSAPFIISQNRLETSHKIFRAWHAIIMTLPPMKSISSLLERLFQISTLVAAAGTVFAILFLPTSTVLRLIHKTPETFDSGTYGFAVFTLIFVTGLCHFLRLFWAQAKKTELAPLPAKSPKYRGKYLGDWIGWFQVLTSVLILGRAILGMDRPFDTDELTMPLHALQGDFHLTPSWFLQNSAHPIASLSSLLSMKIFGLGMYTSRAPAIIMSLFFLTQLFFFCRRAKLKNFTVVLIYAHLLASEIFVWYMHSIRGYISMVWLTFVVFSVAYETVHQIRPLTKTRFLAYCLSLFLFPMTHAFSVVFALMFFTAFLFWFLYFNGDQSREYRQYSMRLIIALFCFTPYFAFFLLQAFLTIEAKYINIATGTGPASQTVPAALQLVLGSSHVFVLKLIALVTAGVLLYQAWNKKPLKEPFCGLVILFFVGFVAIQHSLMGTYLAARFLLTLPLLFVLWFSESVHAFPKKYVPVFWGIAALTLVAFPVLDGDVDLFQLSRKNFYAFIKGTKKQLAGFPKECIDYSYSGESPASEEMLVAKEFYFKVSPKTDVHCEKMYQLHFGWPWQEDKHYTEEMRRISTFSDLPPNKKYNPVFSDGNGRFLAEIVNP